MWKIKESHILDFCDLILFNWKAEHVKSEMRYSVFVCRFDIEGYMLINFVFQGFDEKSSQNTAGVSQRGIAVMSKTTEAKGDQVLNLKKQTNKTA